MGFPFLKSYIIDNIISLLIVMDAEQTKYRKIAIQDLEPREHEETEPMTKAELSERLNQQWSWIDEDKPLLCYNDSGLGPHRLIRENGLFRTSQFF